MTKENLFEAKDKGNHIYDWNWEKLKKPNTEVEKPEKPNGKRILTEEEMVIQKSMAASPHRTSLSSPPSGTYNGREPWYYL